VPWSKCGLLFEPNPAHGWSLTHAASPVPLVLPDGTVRVFVSCRDAQSRARIGWIDVDLEATAVTRVALRPIAELGELGAFDERGMVGSSACFVADTLRLYYSGWQLGSNGLFWFFTGLLESADGGETTTRRRAPILDRSQVDPLLAGAPFVLFDEGRWRMWYTSGIRWETRSGELRHYYHIKYAESADGIEWQRNGRVAIDLAGEEYAIGRPWVVRDADRYRMWYSYRGASYRLGYAESVDGLTWERRDAEVGIDVGPGAWDSEMIAYGAVIDAHGARWLFYNGNGYGRTGLGLARLSQ